MDGASRVCPGGAGLLARQEGCVMLASVGAVRRTSSAPGGELSLEVRSGGGEKRVKK